MPRIAGVIEARREAQEGYLGKLGNCLVRIEMARSRLQRAASLPNLAGLLDPADQELDRVVRDIRSVQSDLAAAPDRAHSSSPARAARLDQLMQQK